jgi:tetratricopeptide (TPR) repeat protein
MNNTRLQTLLEFLKEDPDDAFTMYAIALEYLKIDQVKAIEYFALLMQKQPEYIGTYYQLGTLFHSINKNEEAEKVFKTGIEMAILAKDQHALAELRTALNNMLLGLDDD